MAQEIPSKCNKLTFFARTSGINLTNQNVLSWQKSFPKTWGLYYKQKESFDKTLVKECANLYNQLKIFLFFIYRNANISICFLLEFCEWKKILYCLSWLHFDLILYNKFCWNTYYPFYVTNNCNFLSIFTQSLTKKVIITPSGQQYDCNKC